MNRAVTVTTGARLHFGLIVARGPSFGSVGLMVEQPGFTIRIEVLPQAASDRIDAPSPVVWRVAEFLEKFRARSATAPVAVTVSRCIPEHAGLGSGTQLGLSIATGLSRLFDATPAKVEELAPAMGRGKRSTVGCLGFARGGCVFSPPAGQQATVVLPTPAAWRCVLFTPPHQQGLSGAEEQRTFQHLPPMSDRLSERLVRIMLEDWKPALERHDFETFSSCLDEFGRLVGEYFAPHQGGLFAHPLARKLAARLRDLGFTGVAQTSWGPTLVVLCQTAENAQELIERLRTEPEWSGCSLQATAPLNHGAQVVLDPD